MRYEIDTLRCIYCGFCVEACPCDAIRMDSGTHPGNLGFSRKEFVETKEVLMERSKELAEKGKEGLYEELRQTLPSCLTALATLPSRA